MGLLGLSINEMVAAAEAANALTNTVPSGQLNADPEASIQAKIFGLFRDAHPTASVSALDTVPGVVENQVLRIVVAGTNQYEECFVDEVVYNFDHYVYKVIGLRSYRPYLTTHIDNPVGDSYKPILLTEVEAAEVRLKAMEVDYFKNYSVAPQARYLTTGAVIASYSEKCLVIFTSNPSDVTLLQTIHAKRNDHLTWQGVKQSGWIIPKCRQADLTKLVAPHYS